MQRKGVATAVYDFLENNEVQDVAQSHLERIVQLETKEAERVIKAYRRIRQDLRDRLDTLPSGTFTAQRLRGVMVARPSPGDQGLPRGQRTGRTDGPTGRH